MQSNQESPDGPIQVITRVQREPGPVQEFGRAVSVLARGSRLRMLDPYAVGDYGGVIAQLVAGLVCDALRSMKNSPQNGKM